MKVKDSWRIFLVLVLFMMPICMMGQNLLLNAGFETATVGMPGGTPIPFYPATLDSWTAANTDGEFIYDLTKAHTGTGFLSVLQNAGANPVTPWTGVHSMSGYDRAGQVVAVSPATDYQLDFWYKYGDGTRYGYGAGDLILNIEQTSPSVSPLLSQTIPTTATWQQISISFTTGPTTTEIIVLFSAAGNSNTDIWIDDASLTDAGCPLPVVDLGNDTSLCAGATLTLDATAGGGSTYLWQDNSTNPTFTVTQAGTYWVEVTDTCGTTTDTINVSYSGTPTVDLGNDTTLCQGDLITLDATTPNVTYLWQDNSTGSTLIVTQPGTYWVELTDNCGTTSDTIVIDFTPIPLVDLGPDSTLCQGETLTLDATATGATYLWQDNSTAATYDVTQQGIYFVEVTVNNCTGHDTVIVNFNPLPVVDFGNDTTLCDGDVLILDASNAGATYLWQDNSTNSTFTVMQSGTYSVDVDLNGCLASSTINVTYSAGPTVDLGPDLELCEGEVALLDPITMANNFFWQDSSTAATFTVVETGTYWVMVDDGCGTATDSVEVLVEFCNIALEMPNVFSPNGDSYNDLFVPMEMEGINSATLFIYNRWGKLLFEGNDLLQGWDGNFEGNPCSDGTYYWIVHFTDRNEVDGVLKGSLTLLK